MSLSATDKIDMRESSFSSVVSWCFSFASGIEGMCVISIHYRPVNDSYLRCICLSNLCIDCQFDWRSNLIKWSGTSSRGYLQKQREAVFILNKRYWRQSQLLIKKQETLIVSSSKDWKETKCIYGSYVFKKDDMLPFEAFSDAKNRCHVLSLMPSLKNARV